ncbi:myeloid-associated differentiation marker homolog [Latimeria chalumnae]|nr:PREDICTED: myeloid-associated differentiation marker homolog [Latimeria chalumnae]|eukprot:XP_006008314.1 PREDICTED: myeloid-associated differentiation marker homolog [Latimeria chalumnae]
MPVLEMDYKSLTSPLGIVRFFEIFLACTAFSLVAHVNAYSGAYGTWCMFTWCFFFIVSFLIVVLELTGLNKKVPISWDDFTSTMAMLATLMMLTASIIYPVYFLNGPKHPYRAAATAMSVLCFVAYAVEVGLTRAKPGEISGFLSTMPGLLKVLEAFVACIIFTLLDDRHLYAANAGRQWCMAVYCFCFIITLLIILLTIGRLLSHVPFPLEKFLIGYNALAVLMYLSAAIVWPIFCFDKNYGNPKPQSCNPGCEWSNLLAATFLTYFNLMVYIVDLIYSTKLVFFQT